MYGTHVLLTRRYGTECAEWLQLVQTDAQYALAEATAIGRWYVSATVRQAYLCLQYSSGAAHCCHRTVAPARVLQSILRAARVRCSTECGSTVQAVQSGST